MPQSEAKITGWCKGHPVWLKDTFDGYRIARRLGERAADMTLVSKGQGQWGAHWLVRLADGSEEYVAQDHLRLTPPPGLTNAGEKARETAPRPRKEAVDPALGEELPLF